jgi:hypothetical protein
VRRQAASIAKAKNAAVAKPVMQEKEASMSYAKKTWLMSD